MGRAPPAVIDCSHAEHRPLDLLALLLACAPAQRKDGSAADTAGGADTNADSDTETDGGTDTETDSDPESDTHPDTGIDTDTDWTASCLSPPVRPCAANESPGIHFDLDHADALIPLQDFGIGSSNLSAFGDIDGDGATDVALVQRATDHVDLLVYRGPEFVRGVVDTPVVSCRYPDVWIAPPTLGDLDGDGRADLRADVDGVEQIFFGADLVAGNCIPHSLPSLAITGRTT